MTRIILFLLITATCCFYPTLSLATKACPLPDCRDAGLNFLDKKCFEKADWIAEGKIQKIKDDFKGYPLNKNFASFKFHPTKWIKKGAAPFKVITFKIGWCHNRNELPEDLSGSFRFYGSDAPTFDKKPHFLDYVRIAQDK